MLEPMSDVLVLAVLFFTVPLFIIKLPAIFPGVMVIVPLPFFVNGVLTDVTRIQSSSVLTVTPPLPPIAPVPLSLPMLQLAFTEELDCGEYVV